LLFFLNLLLSHKCWPRDVKLVENLRMYTPNLQTALGMSLQLSWYIFRRCYVQITTLSLNVVFRKLVFPEWEISLIHKAYRTVDALDVCVVQDSLSERSF